MTCHLLNKRIFKNEFCGFFTQDIAGIKHSNMPSFHLEFEKVSPLEIRIFISVQKRSLVKTIVCDLLGHDKESV